MRPTDQVTHELTGGDGTMPRTRNGQEANIVVNVLSPDGPTPTAPPEFGNAEIHCALLCYVPKEARLMDPFAKPTTLL